jgi:predicted Zn-dependent protease
MSQTELVSEFKKGLTALRSGYPNSAVAHLRKALENDSGNPFCLSYYGLALARAEHNWAMAEASCLAALQMKRNQPYLYLNLAEVYRRAGEMQDALSTLYNGLQFTKWDTVLVRALEELGVRRPPVLSFLDRKNFLNRHLGRLRHRLEGQGKVSALEHLRMVRN